MTLHLLLAIQSMQLKRLQDSNGAVLLPSCFFVEWEAFRKVSILTKRLDCSVSATIWYFCPPNFQRYCFQGTVITSSYARTNDQITCGFCQCDVHPYLSFSSLFVSTSQPHVHNEGVRHIIMARFVFYLRFGISRRTFDFMSAKYK